jgi:hypothetical protein
MANQSDDEKRVEEFYRLLSAYGLTGRSQPISRRKNDDMNQEFSSEEE